jgi:glycosyltransferase involved in cell wall biosynthesis
MDTAICFGKLHPMRILQVHNNYIQSGGEDTVFQAETALLRENGHEVMTYLVHNEKITAMKKLSVALNTLWSYSSYQKLKMILKDVNPAVVHFHNIFPLISPSAYYACQDMGIPVVQTIHNQRLICPGSSFYRDGRLCIDCLDKFMPWPGILHACYHDSHLQTSVVASMSTLHRWLGTWRTKIDTYICSTNFYRDIFIRAGFPPEKIVVKPHFVRQRPRPELPRGQGSYALFIGRLDPEKGISTLLKAWRNLDVPLKIRGSGRLDAMARGYVEQYGLTNIEFIGRVEENELLDLIRNARFLVMPSEGYYETFGLVIIPGEFQWWHQISGSLRNWLRIKRQDYFLNPGMPMTWPRRRGGCGSILLMRA